MKIEIDKLEKLIVDSNKIFLTPEGEEVLIQLLEIRQQVEDAIDAAEQKLEETGLKIDPNFSSIQSNKVKVYYRAFGARYKIDPSLIDKLPKNLYEVSMRYNAVAKEIEKFAEENKGLPQGIIEAERAKQITFSLKNKENENE